jgi:hypothetical protein
LAIAGLGLLLQSCAKPPPPASTARLFASDLAGAAKQCTVPSVTPVAGKSVAAAMKVGNDGGWCAITMDIEGKPFAAGLLVGDPAHGRVMIHTVGDSTRIDYTPETQFVGGDSFAVRLLPGDATVQVSVMVSGP